MSDTPQYTPVPPQPPAPPSNPRKAASPTMPPVRSPMSRSFRRSSFSSSSPTTRIPTSGSTPGSPSSSASRLCRPHVLAIIPIHRLDHRAVRFDRRSWSSGSSCCSKPSKANASSCHHRQIRRPTSRFVGNLCIRSFGPRNKARSNQRREQGSLLPAPYSLLPDPCNYPRRFFPCFRLFREPCPVSFRTFFAFAGFPAGFPVSGNPSSTIENCSLRSCARIRSSITCTRSPARNRRPTARR